MSPARTKATVVPTIAMVGGGSGGHLTPLLALAAELKKQRPDCRLIFIGWRGEVLPVDKLSRYFDKQFVISAGKLRRYHGRSWLARLIDVKTLMLNIRDSWRLAIGCWQAWRLLGRQRPHLVFS